MKGFNEETDNLQQLSDNLPSPQLVHKNPSTLLPCNGSLHLIHEDFCFIVV